jgi:hypothetical protein
MTDEPAQLGIGRCLGFILGGLPLTDGFISRVALAALVPEPIAEARSTAFNVTFKRWLRHANASGRIRRGSYIVQPVDTAGLVAEALRDRHGWRPTDYLDLGRPARLIAGHHGDYAVPDPAAERVAVELEWLSSLDLSTLPSAR